MSEHHLKKPVVKNTRKGHVGPQGAFSAFPKLIDGSYRQIDAKQADWKTASRLSLEFEIPNVTCILNCRKHPKKIVIQPPTSSKLEEHFRCHVPAVETCKKK
jgi:hypothetical protein